MSFSETIEKILEGLPIVGPYKKYLLGLKPKINLSDNLNHYFSTDVYPPFESDILKDVYTKTLIEYSPDLYFLKEKLKQDFDVFFTNGALAGIEQILHTFCRESEKVLTFSPTFPFYKDICIRKYLDFKEISLEGDNLTDLNIEKAQEFSPKVIILCDPNNPIGTRFEADHLEELIVLFKDSLVIIDETYIEFSENPSNLRFLKDYQNLLVIRGLSKGWGMASLRLCGIFGTKNLIECLKRYCVAYPVSLLSIKSAISRFTHEKEFALSSWESIRKDRDRIIRLLEKKSVLSKVYPSETNFICFSSSKCKEIKENLFQEGILIEDVSHIIPNSLRLTVGRIFENDLFLRAFSKTASQLSR